MKLVFEVYPYPGDFEAKDEILIALNDDGLRASLEEGLALAIQSVMYWERKIYVKAKLKEWDVK